MTEEVSEEIKKEIFDLISTPGRDRRNRRETESRP